MYTKKILHGIKREGFTNGLYDNFHKGREDNVGSNENPCINFLRIDNIV